MIHLRNTKHKNSFRPPLKRKKACYYRCDDLPRPFPRTRRDFYQWAFKTEAKAEWIDGRLVLS